MGQHNSGLSFSHSEGSYLLSVLEIATAVFQPLGCLFFFYLFTYYFIYLFFTLQYCIGFAIYQQESATGDPEGWLSFLVCL